MDLLESGQATHSASAKGFMCSEVFDGNCLAPNPTIKIGT